MGKKINRKSKRWMRWLLRIFISITVILIIGFIALYFFLRVGFSGKKIRSLITEKVFATTGRPLYFEKIAINLFGEIDIREIKIGFTEEENMGNQSFLELKRFTVRYKLLPLLRRRIAITEVIIDEPRLHLLSPSTTLKRNEAKIEANREQKNIENKNALQINPLPFSINLFNFVLNDFDVTITNLDSKEKNEFILENLNLELSDMNIPRDLVGYSDAMSANIHFFTKSSNIIWNQGKTEIKFNHHSDFRIQWQKMNHWSSEGFLKISPYTFHSGKAIECRFKVDGFGLGEQIQIKEINLGVDEQLLFSVSGEMRELVSDGFFRFDIDGDRLDLKKLLNFLNNGLPADYQKKLAEYRVNGDLYLVKGAVWGSLDSLQFQIHSHLRNGNIFIQDRLELWDTDFNLDVSGCATLMGLKWGRISGSFNIGSIMADLNDTTTVSMKEIAFKWNTKVDSDMIPTQALIKGEIQDLFGDNINLEMKVQNDQKRYQGIEGIIAEGRIWADSIKLALLPGLDSRLDGELGVSVDWDIHGFDDMVLHMACQSQEITYLFENREETSPPVDLTSNIYFHMDPQMNKIECDSGFVFFSDIFSGFFNGVFTIPEKRFNLSIKNAEIQNDLIFRFLPTSLEEKMNGLSFRGREVVHLNLFGQQQDDSVKVSLSGSLALDDLNLAIVSQRLAVNDIGGEIQIKGNLRRLYGNGEFYIKSLYARSIRPNPIRDTELSFNWSMKAQDQFVIEKGIFNIPSLLTQAEFDFRLENLTSIPTLFAGATLNFHSPDWFEILPDIKLIGDLYFRLHASTIHPQKQWFRLAGELNIDSMEVVQENGLSIHGLWSRLPFQIDFDQKNGEILSDSLYSPPSWIEYENQRLLYHQMTSSTENLTIHRIDFADFQISDVGFDIHIDRGVFQVPWFSMKLFDGNLGGNIVVNPGKNLALNSSYSIRAQASRINSAALANIQINEEEESELNGRLHFYGEGLNFSEEIDLSGIFDITKIGSKFANLLLEGMDPKGEDASIKQTRRLLRWGAKPEIFSFELRHGLVYPSLTLTKPWFSPIPIPRRWQYGRLPLGFLLKRFSTLNQ